MKKLLFLIVLTGLFSSCTVNKPPEFKSIDHIEVETKSLDNIEITARFNFHNPNDIGCEISKMDIDVITNGINIGKANELEMSQIDSNDDFFIPAKINVSPKKIYGGGLANLIGGAISAFVKKEIEVEFQGTITLKKLGMSFEIPIHEKQMVPILKNKE
jgi:LEA14-like dessication related protein